MQRLGIISNPFAKMNKNYPEHNTHMWYTLANNGLYKITHSLIELEKVCQEFAERKINLVGIVGGDGSIGLVLSSLLKAYGDEQSLPKILLLKGGTINFLALNLGIRTDALTCLNDTLFFLKKNLSLYEISVRTIQINGRIGFIFAGGIASALLEEFYKNKTNSFGAFLSMSNCLLDAMCRGKINGLSKKIIQPQKLSITTHPTSLWSTKPFNNQQNFYTLVFASTVPKLPFNVHLFKKIALKNLSAEILVTTESKGGTLFKQILMAFIGRDITSFADIDSVIFERATIQSEFKLSYSLDGDLCFAEDGEIEIKYGPIVTFCSPYFISNKAHN